MLEIYTAKNLRPKNSGRYQVRFDYPTFIEVFPKCNLVQCLDQLFNHQFTRQLEENQKLLKEFCNPKPIKFISKFSGVQDETGADSSYYARLEQQKALYRIAEIKSEFKIDGHLL